MHVHTAPTVDPTLCIQGNHTCRLSKVNITPTDTEEWNGYFYWPLLAAYGIAETLETLKTVRKSSKSVQTYVHVSGKLIWF